MLGREELLVLPADPDAVLPRGVADRLPATTPPPPWRSPVEATLWLTGRGLGLGGFVRYLDGAVGPYDEVFASVPRGRSGHVPFMAVDSIASVHGGRAHWALPKTLARFDGRLRAQGDGWHVSAALRARPRSFPLVLAATCVQPWPDGRWRTFTTWVRGRARVASVEVEAEGVRWLAPGRHPGLDLRGRITVGAPRA